MFMNEINLKVKETSEIMFYLLKYTNYSKSKIKSLFKYKKIYVNGSNRFKLPFVVNENDMIRLVLATYDVPFEIIYENQDIIVVNKPSGLLTVATDKEKENTLYRQVKDYGHHNNFKIYVVHRLDRDTSGIVLFSKKEYLKELWQNNWNKLVLFRGYYAVVEGIIDKKGRIENFLWENHQTFVKSSKYGKKAITNYFPLKISKQYTLLDINIETGRKNQIRVHLAELGHPIVGDKKYGSKNDPLFRLGLHAYKLVIKHPITGQELKFESKIPNIFEKIVK